MDDSPTSTEKLRKKEKKDKKTSSKKKRKVPSGTPESPTFQATIAEAPADAVEGSVAKKAKAKKKVCSAASHE